MQRLGNGFVGGQFAAARKGGYLLLLGEGGLGKSALLVQLLLQHERGPGPALLVYFVRDPGRRRPEEFLSSLETGESGRRRAQAFCADCGTPIYSAESDDPQAYAIRLGTAREPALRADRAG